MPSPIGLGEAGAGAVTVEVDVETAILGHPLQHQFLRQLQRTLETCLHESNLCWGLQQLAQELGRPEEVRRHTLQYAGDGFDIFAVVAFCCQDFSGTSPQTVPTFSSCVRGEVTDVSCS